MNSSCELLRQQYGFVKESRDVLLGYCKQILPQDFVKENISFGRGGSMRNLLVHIINTYEFWIGECALVRQQNFTIADTLTLREITSAFASVDNLMSEAFELFEKSGDLVVKYQIGEITGAVELFKIFSHVMTHEFHHKGQILSISRHLGYIPIDTDIIR